MLLMYFILVFRLRFEEKNKRQKKHTQKYVLKRTTSDIQVKILCSNYRYIIVENVLLCQMKYFQTYII